MPGGDEFLSAISADGFVSAKAIVTSSMVREVATLQSCQPLAAAALGRALTCTLLVADGLKHDETFQVDPPPPHTHIQTSPSARQG